MPEPAPPHGEVLTAVLDACVLYPAPLRDTLLRLAKAGLYKAQWSAEILEEVRRNLAGRRVSPEQAQRLIGTMMEAFPGAAVIGYEPIVAAMTNDAKDRHVLAAAVAIGAQVIVTDNLRHFPPSALMRFRIVAEAPDPFLSRLFATNSELVTQTILRLAGALSHPTQTVAEVLATLARHAPGFAALVRQELG